MACKARVSKPRRQKCKWLHSSSTESINPPQSERDLKAPGTVTNRVDKPLVSHHNDWTFGGFLTESITIYPLNQWRTIGAQKLWVPTTWYRDWKDPWHRDKPRRKAIMTVMVDSRASLNPSIGSIDESIGAQQYVGTTNVTERTHRHTTALTKLLIILNWMTAFLTELRNPSPSCDQWCQYAMKNPLELKNIVHVGKSVGTHHNCDWKPGYTVTKPRWQKQ